MFASDSSEDQQQKGEKVGLGVLIHGCRTELDFAHKRKADEALAAGTLSKIYPAYSRLRESQRVHIADVIVVCLVSPLSALC